MRSVGESRYDLNQRVVQLVRRLMHQKVPEARQDYGVEIGVFSVGLGVGRPFVGIDAPDGNACGLQG